MDNDLHNRTVSCQTVDNKDVYTINDGELVLSFPQGTSVFFAYDVINAMGPAIQQEPIPEEPPPEE